MKPYKHPLHDGVVMGFIRVCLTGAVVTVFGFFGVLYALRSRFKR